MDARNFDFSDEAPDDTQDGWCYDMSKVVRNRFYMVAYICGDCDGSYRGVYRQALCDNDGTWYYKDYSSALPLLHGTVYAFREIDPLPEPPPLLAGWEESNG